jgi:hypothetical protein
MKLQLSNALQHHIADQLWEAKDRGTVKKILNFYGIDAVIVLNMMLAEYYDNVDATDLAEEVISRIK